jgi:hypothetical protein
LNSSVFNLSFNLDIISCFCFSVVFKSLSGQSFLFYEFMVIPFNHFIWYSGYEIFIIGSSSSCLLVLCLSDFFSKIVDIASSPVSITLELFKPVIIPSCVTCLFSNYSSSVLLINMLLRRRHFLLKGCQFFNNQCELLFILSFTEFFLSSMDFFPVIVDSFIANFNFNL